MEKRSRREIVFDENKIQNAIRELIESESEISVSEISRKTKINPRCLYYNEQLRPYVKTKSKKNTVVKEVKKGVPNDTYLSILNMGYKIQVTTGIFNSGYMYAVRNGKRVIKLKIKTTGLTSKQIMEKLPTCKIGINFDLSLKELYELIINL